MRFFYIHFSKAGGTSLARQLTNAFQGRVLAEYEQNPIGAGHDIRKEAAPPTGTAGVIGHIHPSRYCRWSDVMFTVLREPVANIISIYHYWLSLPSFGNSHHDRFLSERPSILDFARTDPLTTLMSRAFFGDFDMRNFHFVGFHDNRRKALDRISSLLGVSLDPALHLNRTGGRIDDVREEIMGDPQLSGSLRDALKDDVAFYEAMRAQWA